MIAIKTTGVRPAKCKAWIAKFIQYCRAVDVVAMEVLLDDDVIINDQSKWEFLSYVRDRFHAIRRSGNQTLELVMDKCVVCHQGCTVHLFKGNSEKDWIAFYINENDGQLKDIVICNMPASNVGNHRFSHFLTGI